MSIEYINQLYTNDNEIKAYINRFASDHNVTVNEVLNHKIISEYIKYKVSMYG